MKKIIIKAKNKARKDKNRSLLIFLDQVIQNANSIAKADKNRETNDKDFLTALIKTKKSSSSAILEFDKLNIDKNSEQYLARMLDVEYANQFLPSQLSEDEIQNIIDRETEKFLELDKNYEFSMKDMGKLMSHFQTNYNGQFDASIVSNKIRQFLLGSL